MSQTMMITSKSPSRQTWWVALQALILIACFAYLYSHTFSEMIKNWQRDDNYSHGFLIPFVSAYMIWHKWPSLKQAPSAPSNWGIFLILLSMIMHIAGAVSAETFAMRSSIIICLMGVVLFLCGKRRLTAIIVPLLYLFFMIPIPKIIWNQLAFPLQLLSAKLSCLVLQLFSIPVLREGNIIQLSNITLEVVDACSGLRSLTTLLALSGAFAYISILKISSKWALFLAAIPIAPIVNIVRITATGFLARYVGPETANGFLHELSGILVFIISFILLFGIKELLSKIEKPLLWLE
jgi:exosortase